MYRVTVFLLLFLIACGENKKQSDVKLNPENYFYNDSTGLDFINNTFSGKFYSDDLCKYLISETPELQVTNSDSLFLKLVPYLSVDEIDFLKEKFENERYYKYKEEDINNFTLINFPKALNEDDFFSNSETWREFINSHECYLIIEHPIINKEQSLLIVRTVNYCGIECGEESLLLFEKNDTNEWEYVKRIEMVKW